MPKLSHAQIISKNLQPLLQFVPLTLVLFPLDPLKLNIIRQGEVLSHLLTLQMLIVAVL